MDFSNFKTSDWLKIGGALGFLIFGTFVGWASGGGESGLNAFDFFVTGTIPWLLIIATGVIAFLLASGIIKRSGVPWDLVLLAASALATLLVVLRLLIGPRIDIFGTTVKLDRGPGLYLSAIAAIVVLAGCVLAFREAGGTLNDFTNMDKLKGSFNQGGNQGGPGPAPGGYTPPPPPPPPSGPTPPPPPPPGP